MANDERRFSRRDMLWATTAGGVALAVGCGAEAERSDGGLGDGGALDAGPVTDGAVPDGAVPTPECLETETNVLGPAYIDGAPVRDDGDLNVLAWPGTALALEGRVMGADGCTPIANAELDLWQADDDGCYDGSSIGCGPLSAEWPLRGRVRTDGDGQYLFRTLYPGLYPGRTRHIHVIVRAAGYRDLTTQIYFAGEPANATDGGILPSLTVELASTGDGLSGRFDIVLAPA